MDIKVTALRGWYRVEGLSFLSQGRVVTRAKWTPEEGEPARLLSLVYDESDFVNGGRLIKYERKDNAGNIIESRVFYSGPSTAQETGGKDEVQWFQQYGFIREVNDVISPLLARLACAITDAEQEIAEENQELIEKLA